MLLKPHGRIDVDQRRTLFLGTPGGLTILGDMGDPRLASIRSDFVTTQSVQLPATIGPTSLHPSQKLLAWVDRMSGLLRVQTLGAQPTEIAPPRPSPDDCYFDESGDFLWLVESLSDKQVEVRILRTSDWSVVGQAIAEDKHSGSSCSFHETHRPGVVALWLSAGQDGRQVYWLTYTDDGVSCQLASRLADTAPPAFSPDGSHFVAVHDDGTMRCYEFATMREIGSGLKSPVKNDPFMERYCYFDEGHALAGTNEHRIFLINTRQMRLEEELAVEGHEPRPAGEYYPRLAKETGLCTDITWFERMGDVVVFYSDREILWYRAADAKSG